ncbi:hypothetical protein KP509_19G021400 [Ceratopteris richardii]|uniref:PRONE domain-containing protein n=1 Tax=Ceratopteris richardii TaxID=49495 RepID=A0A8T2SKB4_CERRI|nr:hypothetical protein KP509_19G021400 [Ceratopteris richardii]
MRLCCIDRTMAITQAGPSRCSEATTKASDSLLTDDFRFSSDCMSSECQSLSSRVSSNDHGGGNDGTSSNDASPSCKPSFKDDCCESDAVSSNLAVESIVPFWEDKKDRKGAFLSELDVMKERFAKLLLGEDMSGGAKGVSTALAISNAVTNLSASTFGELWRLEPLSLERKVIWKREMDWILSVADHIVELVPSWQKREDGSTFEVMISKPRADLHANLPALRKLDAMLLGFLDSCQDTEFWYVEQDVVRTDDDNQNTIVLAVQREEGKWWLPTPRVAATGLSEGGRKSLQHQRECASQILKAAMAINTQTLSEMEIPSVYWDSLPKSGRVSVGEAIYKQISGDYFSPDAVLCTLDLSMEYSAIEVANRIEAAIHTWRRRMHPSPILRTRKRKEQVARRSWKIVKENSSDLEKRAMLANRAESLLLCLKQKFPGLRQSLLDMTKIQYNKDVGSSILESYSRVLESLAFNIIARIDDVLFIDDMTKRVLPGPPPPVKTRVQHLVRRDYTLSLSTSNSCSTPRDTPSLTSIPVNPPGSQLVPCEKSNIQPVSEKCAVEIGVKEHKLNLGHLTNLESELNRA